MGLLAGNEVRIRLSGYPVPFNDETTETLDSRIYKISNATKEIWDIQTPLAVHVNGAVTNEAYIVDHVKGTVIFSNVDNSRTVTVTGAYVTTSIVGKAHSYTLSETCDIYDVTCFLDSNKKKMMGEMSASGSISDFDVIDSYYRDALLQGKPVLIEIQQSKDLEPKRLWAILESRELAVAMGSPQDSTISFQSTGRFS